jgi:flavin reductase (DIM6/NTAB) family NADH-FMN oxidoreductase RutF
MHTTISPNILYFGTPVVLLSTRNPDGSANLAPMSSVFWLGWRAVLGLGARSQTAQNLLDRGECVLNLPSSMTAAAVDALALTTARNPVPGYKFDRGYRYEADKFGRAGLTPVESETVDPPRAAECPVALEAVVTAVHPLAADDPAQSGSTLVFETRVRRVHVHDDIRVPGTTDHIDPDRWRPLLMSFQKLYGLGPEVHPSRLASIPERMYRSPDVDRAAAELLPA